MGDIKICIEEESGAVTELIAPTEMGLSLMEFLKGYEYPILATCGGMALCATCHVSILEGFEKLNEISDDEYAILDTLPNITTTSRLSCQLKLNHEMDGLKVKICGEG
ncbi:MAG: 2Fe-2S iron-sulfur cluster-binding protein [Bacteroidota bacterium]|jgi:ferredoxin